MSNSLFEKMVLPTHQDERGKLTVLDNLDKLIDWPVKRTYWLTDVKLARGGHCVKGEKKFYVMTKGSCQAKLYDGKNWFEINLKGPNEVLWLKEDMWREFENFSEDAAMFTLCNLAYDKSLYIMNVKEYEEYANNLRQN